MSTDVGVWYTVIGNNQNIVVDVTILDSTSLLRSGIEVALFTGTCKNLICLKSSADQTENPVVNLSWNATTGQQYYIIVAGTSATTGNFSVNIEVCIS
jgi:trimeric autotransporter adhesin